MNSKNKIWTIIVCFVLVAAIGFVVAPLFHKGFFVTDDGDWMIIRLSAFFQSFREGQFPVRFLGRLNNSYGYPVANFLYPGFLYIGSIIHLFGFSFESSVKLILGGSVILATVFVFLWLKRYFSLFPSLVGALGFVLAPYLSFDLLTRGSVGEILAFAWAAMGFFSIAAKKSWLFSLSVALLIVSHNSLAFLFLGIYIPYLLIERRWREFFPMFMFGIGMVTFFWLPALYERKYVVFDKTFIANSSDYFIVLKNSFLVGFAGIGAGVLCLFSDGSFKKQKRFFLIALAVILFFVVPLSEPLWGKSLLNQFVQFPYRFLSVALFLSSWLIAYSLENQKDLRLRLMLSCLFAGMGVWTSITMQQHIAYVERPDGYYTTNEATTTVRDEYMPRWVVDKPTDRASVRVVFYKGRGVLEPKRLNTQVIDVVVHASEASVLQINTVYYPGWGATLDDGQVQIDYKNRQGVMRINVPQGTHHLVAGFRETISRFLADNISVLFFLWYIFTVFMASRKKNNKA